MTQNSKVISLITTHNARIQCFLETTFSKSHGYLKQGERIRFQNASALRLSFEVQKNPENITYSLELVYPGELDAKKMKGAYYCKDVKEECRSFPYISANMASPEFEKTMAQLQGENNNYTTNEFTQMLLSDFPNNTLVFYIIRHGEAEHNKPTTIATKTHMKRDTSLTKNGRAQAIRAGMHLRKVFGSFGESTIDYLFCSDLLRTRQTMAGTICSLSSPFTTLSNYPEVNEAIASLPQDFNREQAQDYQITCPDYMTVLPCAHELAYSEGGDCDKKSKGKLSAKENLPNCIIRSILQDTPDCITISTPCESILDVNWDNYLTFYGNTTRDAIMKSSDRKSY